MQPQEIKLTNIVAPINKRSKKFKFLKVFKTEYSKKGDCDRMSSHEYYKFYNRRDVKNTNFKMADEPRRCIL